MTDTSPPPLTDNPAEPGNGQGRGAADQSEPAGERCENCAKLESAAEDFKAGWQRARADYMNLLKEVEQEKSEWASWSKLHIIEEFIPVYDNFKKAFAHRPAPNGDKYWHNWAEGVGFIMKQFGDVLKSHEIEEIKTVGDPFNPERHETVAEEESDEYPEHAIIREVDGGYMLKGKVIRAAKVVVAKKKE